MKLKMKGSNLIATKEPGDPCFSGTLNAAVGYYGVKQEHALVIDIITDNDQAVMSVAYAIKKRNKQKEVLVVIVPCGVKTI